MSNIVIPDGGNIGSASDPDAISIASSGKPTFSQGIANTGTIDAGTLGSLVVFPAGHILQVVDAQLTNMLPTSTVVTSTETVLCTADGQITITSGNHVLIYAIGFVYANSGGSNVGVSISIREGLTTSGNQLSNLQQGKNGGGDWFYGGITTFALDTSPASTTPDYNMALARFSSGTASVQNISATLDSNNRSLYHKIFLMEVKA